MCVHSRPDGGWFMCVCVVDLLSEPVSACQTVPGPQNTLLWRWTFSLLCNDRRRQPGLPHGWIFLKGIPHHVYYGAVLPRRRPHHVSMLSVCLSVPCLYLEGKRKGLWIPNLVGRVPGTPAPRGPISRSRGQRSRSRRLIALLVKLRYQYGMIIDYVARTYSTASTAP